MNHLALTAQGPSRLNLPPDQPPGYDEEGRPSSLRKDEDHIPTVNGKPSLVSLDLGTGEIY